jgi:hypothetical protein
MPANTILFGWNRPLPGRERISAAHFDEFVAYLEGLRKKNTITGYDVVFLTPHGGDLNGFFLLRGDGSKLDALVASEDWSRHMTRATLHLDGVGYVRGYCGEAIKPQMDLWKAALTD